MHLLLLMLLIYLNNYDASIYAVIYNYSINVIFIFSFLYIESYYFITKKISKLLKNHIITMSLNTMIFTLLMLFDNAFILKKVLVLCINLSFVLLILLFINFLLCYTSNEIDKDKLLLCLIVEAVYYCFCSFYGNNIIIFNIFKFLLTEKLNIFVLFYYMAIIIILILLGMKRGIYVRDRKYK